MAMSEEHLNEELRSLATLTTPPQEDVEFELSPLPVETVGKSDNVTCGCFQCSVACITCVVQPTCW